MYVCIAKKIPCSRDSAAPCVDDVTAASAVSGYYENCLSLVMAVADRDVFPPPPTVLALLS